MRRSARRAATLAAAVVACSLALAGSAAAAVPFTPGATWSADYSTGDFTQWSWWGQGQEDQWGHISVVNALSSGLTPLAADLPNVARMEVTRRDVARGSYHAKLFKFFSQHGSDGEEHSPEDVTGTYSAWFYLPARYVLARDSWTNVLQFKESFGPDSSEQRSTPLWWVQFNRADWARRYGGRSRWIGRRPQRRAQPVAFINHWDNRWRRTVSFMTVPVERWFEIRAVVRDGRSIDFFLDGRHLDTARAREYPVSPFRSDSRKWIFGIGNYSTAPGTTLYSSAASYSPRWLAALQSRAAVDWLCPDAEAEAPSALCGGWPFVAA